MQFRIFQKAALAAVVGIDRLRKSDQGDRPFIVALAYIPVRAPDDGFENEALAAPYKLLSGLFVVCGLNREVVQLFRCAPPSSPAGIAYYRILLYTIRGERSPRR